MSYTNDRAQAWGPKVREAMALDAAQALRGAQAARWAGGRSRVMAWDELPTHVQADLIANASAAVDAVLEHVRGPMPAGLTIGMSSAAIQAYREGPGDIVERMDRALTAALAAAPQPDQPMPPPPSSARPENGSETMAGAARDVAAEDFAIMLRRMIWQTRKATGDDSMKVLSGQAEALLSRHGMVGNPLRADWPTPQPGEAPQEGEKSAPAAMTPLAAELTKIAAACRPTDHGTMAEAFAAIHTVLSTLVAEREAQARRDERVREAARKLGSETYDVALSALAAALGEDGR